MPAGVPTGTVPANGTLVVADLEPGTYTTTEADPAPRFDPTAVRRDDGGSPNVSRGDPTTRSAIFQLDPGETVRCVFTHELVTTTLESDLIPGGSGGPDDGTSSGTLRI
jgi:hypothetical protein